MVESQSLLMVPRAQSLTCKEGLKLATHSDFRGCVLSDEAGLGKPLTALTAALKLREELPLTSIAALFWLFAVLDVFSSG